jgi:crotonobetainyl-CoA:carnitine CoA-transferase CaiB-like acyl-CoA transferase
VSPDHNGAKQLVEELFELVSLPWDQGNLQLSGDWPLLATSFHVGTLAQSTIAAAALAAGKLSVVRGGVAPQVEVDMHAAEAECTGYFQVDGRSPDSWAPLSGLYPCLDGYVRIHANFDHHRDGALALLGLKHETSTSKQTVIQALSMLTCVEFETRAAAEGVPVYALRTFAEWDATPQADWLASEPLLRITKIGSAAPISLPELEGRLPLSDLRVLDLTRILAGPTCGRALANYGADVMLINSPHLPNIEHIADTSRGKRSAFLDLRQAEAVTQLKGLLGDSHVFVQGYRPGGLSNLGFGPEALAELRPGIISVSLSAFGREGPWADRRGFDSLVQTATGFNHAEAKAAGATEPRALPVQILDFASGFLMAFATSVALVRQQEEGGSWQVDISLAQTAHWLRSLGQLSDNFHSRKINLASRLETETSGFGALSTIPHAAILNCQSLSPRLPSMPPGSHEPVW